MEKKWTLIQIYAAIVNVVVIITFIISLSTLISALIDKMDIEFASRPEHN